MLVYFQVGVGVVEESRFVKKAEERIEMSFGESAKSAGDPIGEAGSSARIRYDFALIFSSIQELNVMNTH